MLLFSVFSVTTSAATVDVGNYDFCVSEDFSLVHMEYTGGHSRMYFDLWDGINSHYTSSLTYSNAKTTKVIVNTYYEFFFDEDVLFSGKSYNLTISNIWCGRKIITSSSTIWECSPDTANLVLYYSNGTSQVVSCEISKYDTQDHYTITTNFLCGGNVSYFKLALGDTFTVQCSGGGNLEYVFYAGEVESCNYQVSVNTIPTVPSLDEEEVDNSEEVGILTNIFNYFKSLYNFLGNLPGYIWEYILYLKNELVGIISNLPSKISDLFSDVLWSMNYHLTRISDNLLQKFNELKVSLSNLPSKIHDGFIFSFNSIQNAINNIAANVVNGIEDIFEKLFVPNEEKYIEMFEKFKKFMLDKFGGLYQIGELFYQRWQELYIEKQADTFTIPKLNLKLPQNVTLNLGPYTFKIVPNGFEFLANILKNIIGIICTLFFVNGLKYRYNRLMGVKE